jgi:proteasome lid subunit RPN8/RPN11
MEGLRKRSAGWRESAAIWVGRIVGERKDWSAERVIFHHELCDDQAGALFLELSETAKFRLYQDLANEGFRIIALLHTHPSSWVDLSDVDRRNQLSSRIGFWSIVVPFYGRRPWKIRRLGVHILTMDGWHRFSQDESCRRVVVED